MNYRSERVQSLIQEELGKLLLREVEFPALVTITSVGVNKKLDVADVRLSVLPSSMEKKSFTIAKKQEKRLQYLLTKKINIRPMPKIRFEIDYGSENAAKVEKLLLDKHNIE